jgi:hypothetical protein
MLVINASKHFQYQTKNPFIGGTRVLLHSDMTEVAIGKATGQTTLKFNNNIFLGFKNTITVISYK